MAGNRQVIVPLRDMKRLSLNSDLYYFIQDCQQAIDHRIFTGLGDDEWLEGENDEGYEWRIHISHSSSGYLCLHLEGRDFHTVLSKQDWDDVKDFMIPSDFLDCIDFRLAVYVFADVLSLALKEKIQDICSACLKHKPYAEREHTCILQYRELQLRFYEEVLCDLPPESFKNALMRKADEYDEEVDSPYLLYHGILRYHMDKVKELVITPDVF